jgi:hypothetical protein
MTVVAMAHSTAVRRSTLALTLLGLAATVGGCGSARTKLPSTVAEAASGEAAADADGLPEASTAPATSAPVTTASAFKSAGEKHRLPGGTLAPSYPRVGVRPPKGVAAPAAGQAWAVVNVRFCADASGPIDGSLLDPARFKLEVPGQGEVAPTPAAPALALAKAPLVAAAAGAPGVAPGTCLEGSIAYLVAGEGHIEAITYDAGAGLLRWAT